MNKTRLLAFLGLSIAFRPAMGLSIEDRTIEELFSVSSSIVLARVVSVDGSCEDGNCTLKYGAEIDLDYKKSNGTKRSLVYICSDRQLLVGLPYAIFLIGAGKDDSKKGCRMSVLSDGIFINGTMGKTYRYMSFGSFNKKIYKDGHEYLSYMEEEPNFLEEFCAVVKRSKGCSSQQGQSKHNVFRIE